MQLSELLHPTWENLEIYRFNGTTFFLGCEVVEMLGISSITLAMGRKLPTPKVSRRNWRLEKIPEINRERAVYLLTYEGIEEMIRNNNNATCKRLKVQLDS